MSVRRFIVRLRAYRRSARHGLLLGLSAIIALTGACTPGTTRDGPTTPPTTVVVAEPPTPTTPAPSPTEPGAAASPTTSTHPSPTKGNGVTTRPTQSTPPQPARPKSWRLVMTDDFSGSTLDMSKWGAYDDLYGNFPRSPRHVSVSDGQLHLTGGPGEQDLDLGSGIASRTNLMYGRFEARFRVSIGAGFGAVVLTWPQGDRWPADGEINLAEVNRGDRATALNYIHNTTETNKRGHLMTADFSQWHEVRMEWFADRVVYYLDGTEVWRVTEPSLIPSTAKMHLVLQLDKSRGCGTFIECRNASSPQYTFMDVDYARVYEWA